MQMFILKLMRIEQSGSVGRQLKASITAGGVTTAFGFTGTTSRHKTLLNGAPIENKIVTLAITVQLAELDPKYNDTPFSGSGSISIDPNGEDAQDFGPITVDIYEIGGRGKNKVKTATLSFFFESVITCRKDKNNMTTSSEGLDFIKSIEGVRYTAYQDQAGYWTIGVGHRIRKGEEYLKTKTLTDAEVDSLLAAEIRAAFNEYVYITNPKTHKKEVSQGLVNRRKLEADLYLS